MFELIGDDGHGNGIHALFSTQAEAVAHAHAHKLESFEIYNEDDRQVYAERPIPVWR